MIEKNARRGMCCAVLMSVFVSFYGCSIAPRKDDESAKLAAQEQFNDRLAAAEKAQKEGHADQAIEQLNAAIKIDPATKTPWLKKAQIHFEAHQYGPAITDAQEVLQRDVNDLTAKSILAVSGLRVSADALEQLRKVNEVNGSAREEAESVARLIRQALGEPILVAAPAASAPESAKPARTRVSSARSMGGGSTPPRSNGPAAVAPAAGTAVKSTSISSSGGSPAGRNNPFGALQ